MDRENVKWLLNHDVTRELFGSYFIFLSRKSTKWPIRPSCGIWQQFYPQILSFKIRLHQHLTVFKFHALHPLESTYNPVNNVK